MHDMFVVEAHPEDSANGLHLVGDAVEIARVNKGFVPGILGALTLYTIRADEGGNFLDFKCTQKDEIVTAVPRNFLPVIGALLGQARDDALLTRRNNILLEAAQGRFTSSAVEQEMKTIHDLRHLGFEITWLTHEGYEATYTAIDMDDNGTITINGIDLTGDTSPLSTFNLNQRKAIATLGATHVARKYPLVTDPRFTPVLAADTPALWTPGYIDKEWGEFKPLDDPFKV